MTAAEISQVADILERIKTWPATTRVTLARRILETVETDPRPQPPTRPRGPSAAEVGAMFKSDRPVPSDEDCERILEEELLRKYAP